MRKLTVVTIALTLSLGATEIYTLEELTLKALQNSPDLKISAYNYEASKSRYDQAYSDYLPIVDFRLSTGVGQISDQLGAGGDMVTNQTALGGLSAKQLLYDFGKTDGKVDRFKFDSEMYSSQNIQLISDKKRDVKSTYYEVLKSIALINVQKENVKLNEAQLYRAEKYFTAGIRTKIDVSDAKVSLLHSKLALKNALYDLKLSYTSLDEAIGFKEINSDYEVSSKILDLNNIYDSITKYSLSLEESINFAYENREALKKSRSQIKSAESENVEVESEYYPQLSLDGSYTQQTSDKLKNVLPKQQWKVSANLNWNLYQGGATDALAQEKQIKLSTTQTDFIYSKLLIKTEVNQAYINVYKMKDSVELSQSILEVSNDKFDQAGKRYKNGLSDFIELQQARQGYIDAMANLVVDYYSYYVAVAILDNAIGK